MLAQSFLFVLISEILYNLSSYVVHSGMGRILGPANYGRYGVVITLTTMIIVLVGNGVPTAMAKYLSEVFDKKPGLVPVIKRQAAITQTILIGSLTVIFFLLSPVIANILGDPSLTRLFQISTLVIPAFALASFYFSYYTGLHKFNVQAILKITRSVARILFILGLAWLLQSRGLALEGAIVGYILVPLSVFFEANFYDSYRKQKPEGTFDWRKLLKYAWPVTLFMVAYEFLITIDLYMVKGILHDDFLTGIYNAAITVGRIPYYLFYALTIILLPTVSKATANNNQKDTKMLVGQSLRLMVMFLVPICILMSLYADPLIRIFYSREFIEAAQPMSIFVFGVGFLTVFYVLTFILNGAGKVKIPMIIASIGLIINIILTYFLIKQYGIIGAVVGTTITSFAIMIIILVYTYNYFGFLFKFTSFLKILFASALMFALSFVFPRDSFMFPIWSGILLVFYIFLLYILREFGPFEIDLTKKMFTKKKRSDI